jgi:hypothetical protein
MASMNRFVQLIITAYTEGMVNSVVLLFISLGYLIRSLNNISIVNCYLYDFLLIAYSSLHVMPLTAIYTNTTCSAMETCLLRIKWPECDRYIYPLYLQCSCTTVHQYTDERLEINIIIRVCINIIPLRVTLFTNYFGSVTSLKSTCDYLIVLACKQ